MAAQRVPPSASRTSQSTHTVRSPRPWKSITPRSERPMSRWISTVRPSGRPLATSRRFRSPVEAGSMPYSAVTQPRPWPDIQRGTSSSTVAVQMTRVPPASMRQEPSAVRTKPGTMLTSRRSPGERPSWRRSLTAGCSARGTGSRPRSRCARFPWCSRCLASGGPPPDRHLHVHVLHLPDRELEEPRAHAAELLGVARGEEAVLPATALAVLEAGLAQARLDLVSDRLPRAHDGHAAAQLPLQNRADERVVGAAEDDGVHTGALQRPARAL